MSTPSARVYFKMTAVRLDLDNTLTVAAFLKQRQQLDFSQCLTLVNEAILMLEGLYVHLPVKRAMYAVDPVRRLQLLKLRLTRYEEQRRRIARRKKLKAENSSSRLMTCGSIVR